VFVVIREAWVVRVSAFVVDPEFVRESLRVSAAVGDLD
jgi:hypothetical protein